MYNTNGLKEDEVKESRKRYGSNSINEKNKNTFFNSIYKKHDKRY